MTEATREKFEHWAIVELFGHQRIAGKVTEETFAGGTFLRVDVPEVTGPHSTSKPFTRFYGPSAIYSLTPTSEEVARLAALQLQADPVTVYIPTLRALPRGPEPGDTEFIDDE